MLVALSLAFADTTVPVQGFLVDSTGVAVHGTRQVVVGVHTAASGAAAFSETLSVSFDRGSFAFELGAGSSLDDALWTSAGDRWISVGLAGDAPSTPVRVGAAPRAVRAEVAATAERLGTLAPADVALAGHGHAFGEITGVTSTTAWPGTASFLRMTDVTSSTAWPGTASFSRVTDVTSSTAWPGTASFSRLTDVTSSTAWPGTVPWSRVTGVDGSSVWPGTIGGYVKTDGSAAMTGALTLPSSLPTASTHAVTKSYADTTLLGVRPTSVLQIRGTGQNCVTGCDRDVLINGNDVVGNSRGLSVTVINRSTHAFVETRSYDTHGLTADADAMATFLNSLNSSVFVVITSYDAWTTSLTDNARNALARIGSTYAPNAGIGCCDDLTPGRTAYALIGVPGAGIAVEQSNPSGVAQAELDVVLMGRTILGQGNGPLVPQAWHAYGGSASYSATTSWADIPGATIAFVLPRRANVKMDYALSFSAETGTNHCGFRFVVDGVAKGNATYGNAIHMGSATYGWWQSHTDTHVEALAAGAHSFQVQIRSVNGGICITEANDYARPWLTATAFPF